jgi:hypothetical protein
VHLECDMCKNKIELKDYNHFSLEGVDFSIKKIICQNCAKRIAKFISRQDKRIVEHSISNIITEEGMKFKLIIFVDNTEYYTHLFNTYREANNFILPLVKLKNRYSKQIMLNKVDEIRAM